jgi:hypothetical protein
MRYNLTIFLISNLIKKVIKKLKKDNLENMLKKINIKINSYVYHKRFTSNDHINASRYKHVL